MNVYYNEFDKFAAQWLRNLIGIGLIPPGDVDERDIRDVRPDDLRNYRQCHFFAGIGGWPHALDLAGWGDRPVWTGSCPCQPLSSAGQRKGHADERHLWPAFHCLISERRPAIVFGEQVASKDGREWLAGVRADLEALGYAIGAADLCVAGVGAPHIRQRLYWLADAGGGNTRSRRAQRSGKQRQQPQDSRCPTGMEYAEGQRLSRRENDQDHRRRQRSLGRADTGDTAGLGHPTGAGQQEQWGEYRPCGERCSGLAGLAMQVGVPEWNGPTIAVECSDGPRRVSAQSDAFPMAHGVSARMGKLRGAGNAICPQAAAEFIRAYLEVRSVA